MTFIAIAFLLLMLFAFVMLALSPPERVSWRRRRLGEDSHDDFSGGLFPSSGGDDSHHGHHGDHGGGHDGGGGGSGDSGGH